MKPKLRVKVFVHTCRSGTEMVAICEEFQPGHWRVAHITDYSAMDFEEVDKWAVHCAHVIALSGAKYFNGEVVRLKADKKIQYEGLILEPSSPMQLDINHTKPKNKKKK